MGARIAKRLCIDCGSRLKNRSKVTVRCMTCEYARRAANAKGRTTGNCLGCGKRLSTKKNVTGRCRPCGSQLWKKHGWPAGKPAWNKGLSRFKSAEHERSEINRARKLRRQQMPLQEHLADRIRTLIRNSLRRIGLRKDTKTAILLGCSTAEFKEHLERLFVEGMSWENYGNGKGKWNIDHILPLYTFDLSDRDEQLKAFHYTNCRPLWALENIARNRYRVRTPRIAQIDSAAASTQ